MNVLLNLALALQILSAIALIVVILIQHGQGADMGAAFGSGGSGSLFGASGSGNFLSHITAILAVVFLGTTLALAHFGYSVPGGSSGESVLDRVPISAPAAPSESKSDAPAVQTPESKPADGQPASGGVDAIPQAAVGAGAATSTEAATPPAGSTPSTESKGSESGAAQIPTK